MSEDVLMTGNNTSIDDIIREWWPMRGIIPLETYLQSPSDFEEIARFLEGVARNTERSPHVEVSAVCSNSWFQVVLRALDYLRTVAREVVVLIGSYVQWQRSD